MIKFLKVSGTHYEVGHQVIIIIIYLTALYSFVYNYNLFRSGKL